jgi:ketosteroid isomerase-like protein
MATMTLTQERVSAAYAALGSGDQAQIDEYWDPNMRWLVPGSHQLAGWYEGRDAFLGFMKRVGQLSDNSFVMTPVTILLNDEYSGDVTHNLGWRSGAKKDTNSLYEKLDIDVIHVLRWRNGRVIEARGAIFGDGATQFNQFWSQVGPEGARAPG